MTTVAQPEPLDAQTLYGLAPSSLTSYRNIRYDGDGLSVQIDDFMPDDRAVIVRLYEVIDQMLEIVRTRQQEPDLAFDTLREHSARVRLDQLTAQVRELRSEGSPTRAKVLHDIKGGGFMALTVYVQMIELGMAQPGDAHRIFCLARDQLKIMRNGVRGLDEERYNRDTARNLHGVDLLIEKWGRGEGHRVRQQAVEVRVESRYDGAIAERCLEFSALDRVIYNLMNNAATHTADGLVDMAILPLGAPEAVDLRFVIYNSVSPGQRETLERRFGGEPGALFKGGFTTGGTGLGMRICADFVCNAYGLHDVDQALAGGYLGAAFVDDRFVTWFHWPVAAD